MTRRIPFSRLRAATLAVLPLCGLMLAGGAQAHSRTAFNPAFLAFGARDVEVDLDTFAESNVMTPGVHPVEVTVNGEPAGLHAIRFIEDGAGRGPTVRSCVSETQLAEFGVNLAALPEDGITAGASGEAADAAARDAEDPTGAAAPAVACRDPEARIPGARVSVDPDRRVLALTVPQARMKRIPRGSVDPSRWDDGIDAVRFDYRLSGARRRDQGLPGGRATDGYANLRGGVNIGPWRLRGNATAQYDNRAGARAQLLNAYLERDLPAWRSRMTLGDSATDDPMFDSVAFTGIQIGSDDSMKPDSQRGYAPVVRGIAQSHAKVEVRQNGFLIHSEHVPPGPFEIDDLYAIASNADLEVTIVEADGQARSFVQPATGMPTLLRHRAWLYRVAAGRLRGDTRGEPWFLSASAAYGLPGETTVFGGTILASDYAALALGAARNLGDLGALSVDLTHARHRDRTGRAGSGEALRVMYTKAFDVTGTELRLARHHYAADYRSLSDVALYDGLTTSAWRARYGQRARTELTLTQPLGRAGSLYVNAQQRDYRGGAGRDQLVQVGYSSSIARVPFSVNLSRESRPDGAFSRQVSVNVSVPLGRAQRNRVYGTATLVAGDEGSEQRAGVYGTLLADDRLSYGVDVDRRADRMGGSVNLNYRAAFGQYAVTHAQSRDGAYTSFSAAGGALLHGAGLTLSQPLGETVALVRSPGAQHVGVVANAGVRTDRAGYAVVPNLTPYRGNRVALRTSDLDRQLEIRQAAVQVVPTRGAVVLASFEVESGRMLLNVVDDAGKPLPFGASVRATNGKEIGMIGPDGQGFVSGAGPAGDLVVRWGDGADERCALSFDVSQRAAPDGAHELDVVCSRAHVALANDSTEREGA